MPANKVIGEIVLPIHYPGGTRYQKVGALVELAANDRQKGPGFMILLDRTFNPAGAPAADRGDGSSVALSVYHPKPKEVGPLEVRHPPASRPAAGFDDMDDDIPF